MRWLLAHADVAPAPAWTMAALVGASIGWLAWRGGSGPDARLAWNGSTWSWSVGDDAAVAVERVDLRLDLGGFLLLHLAGRELPGGARWVAADGRDRDALRLLCAVLYAGAGRAAAAPTPR